MKAVDPRLVAALRRQLAQRPESARVLSAVGERLLPGDRVITGLIVNTPIASGDHVVAELGTLGRVSLRIA